MSEMIGWALMGGGAWWMLLSAVGLHRLRSPLSRLQVAGKAGTLGVVAVLVGAALVVGDGAAAGLLLVTAVVLLVTTPAGAQTLTAVATDEKVPTRGS